MSSSADVHFQIIRIALGYSLRFCYYSACLCALLHSFAFENSQATPFSCYRTAMAP